ncbi:(d)CMP kinase [Yinghuangia seranimata]|uniref:(d)CMP kinase n=1 Tax=Yinghuangia seranimata TaxID=408067 RepID=UPI00248BBB45|nr:(d)CMP kinase [Yinghuangia seranimata]MDI2131812.1 (d)CMP kinase [Yinghuangia seranimata]
MGHPPQNIEGSSTVEARTPLATIVVAVDGPSGSGKSSVSRAVAQALGLRYLDTGAMYRAVTWWMLGNGVDVHDAAAVAAAADKPDIVSGTDPAGPTITVDGVDVAGPIRGPEVTAAVSAVSAVPEIRTRLVALQRAAIGEGGMVVEGRDIGTVVTPDAALKVYLTASEAARAARRNAEHNDPRTDVAATQADLARRDALDSGRVTAPLSMAADGVLVDTTEMDRDQVVAHLLGLVEDRLR